MRTNLPVTGSEYVCPIDCETQISLADLSGRITYCNEAFMKACGYSACELIGQPHSIVRHPDMPQTIFREMWDTIERGFLWVGTLKNRRKNGDHYWVVTNAAPVRDGIFITGYLSVRRPATRAEIRAAELQCLGVSLS